MDLLEVMRKRRSIRKYTGEKIPEKAIDRILKAGLLSPSGRGVRPWEFIVVRDRDMLKEMSECRVGAAKMLEGADCAIVVLGDEEKTDVWVEDWLHCHVEHAFDGGQLGVGAAGSRGG